MILKRFVIGLSLLLLSNIQLLANIDSCRNSIGFHFYQTALRSSDNYGHNKSYLTDNHLLSYSVYYNRNVLTYKKFSLSLMAGLNYKTYQVGYLQSSQSLPPTTGSFSFKNNTASFNIGVLAERPVINYKRTSVLLGLGAYMGWVFNSTKKDYKVNYPSAYSNKADEYSVYFHNAKGVSAYSLVQVRISYSLKNLAPYLGTRVIGGGNYLSSPIASYSIFYTTDPNGDYTYTAGKFGTSGPKFEFFAGLSF